MQCENNWHFSYDRPEGLQWGDGFQSDLHFKKKSIDGRKRKHSMFPSLIWLVDTALGGHGQTRKTFNDIGLI